ncbi:hypothetical protein [Saccharothrix texasensis]|uniref:hypothetical protein n=1 Tax=Saccharothrix texasensis TaxID=103734 RepID=UPI000F4B83FF|nr:hypothetical protein [Saccharothrix texasensis]
MRTWLDEDYPRAKTEGATVAWVDQCGPRSDAAPPGRSWASNNLFFPATPASLATAACLGEPIDGLLLTDAVMMLLLRGEHAPPGVDSFADAAVARWATVHRATGMAIAVLNIVHLE